MTLGCLDLDLQFDEGVLEAVRREHQSNVFLAGLGVVVAMTIVSERANQVCMRGSWGCERRMWQPNVHRVALLHTNALEHFRRVVAR